MLRVDIAVPAADVQRLNDRLGSYVAFLRGNVPKAVDSVAVQLVKSLRVATKQKPAIKLRPVVANPKFNKGIKKMGRTAQKAAISAWYETNAPERNKVTLDPDSGVLGARWAVDRIKRGKHIAMPVFTPGKSTANTSSLRKMKKSGLATSTWGWILGKLSAESNTAQPKTAARGSVVSVALTSSDTEYSRTIHNALPYIRPNTDTASAIPKVDGWLRGRMRLALDGAKQAARVG